jgi:hypothetical protein
VSAAGGVAAAHVRRQLSLRGEHHHLAHLLAQLAAVVRLAEVVVQILKQLHSIAQHNTAQPSLYSIARHDSKRKA